METKETCELCGVEVLNLIRHEETKKHLNKVNGIAPNSCDNCNYIGPSRPALSQHKKRHHSDQEVKLYNYFQCKVCDVGIVSKANVKTHITSKGHKQNIKQNYPDLIDNDTGKINVKEARKLVIKLKTTRKKSGRTRIKKIPTTSLDVKPLTKIDYYANLGEKEISACVKKLISYAEMKNMNLEDEMAYDHYKTQFDIELFYILITQ